MSVLLSFFVFPQLYCEDTFGDWLPECRLCLELVSQVTGTGHFLTAAVINRTLGLMQRRRWHPTPVLLPG